MKRAYAASFANVLSAPTNPSILQAYGFAHEWQGGQEVSLVSSAVSRVNDLIGSLDMLQSTAGDRPAQSGTMIVSASSDYVANDNGTSDGHSSSEVLVDLNADMCMIAHFDPAGAASTGAVQTAFCIGSSVSGTFAQIGYFKDSNLAVCRWNSSSFQHVPAHATSRMTVALIRRSGSMLYSLDGGAKTGSISLSGQDINVTGTLQAAALCKRVTSANSEFGNWTNGLFLWGVGQVVPSDGDLSAIHTACLAL